MSTKERKQLPQGHRISTDIQAIEQANSSDRLSHGGPRTDGRRLAAGSIRARADSNERLAMRRAWELVSDLVMARATVAIAVVVVMLPPLIWLIS